MRLISRGVGVQPVIKVTFLGFLMLLGFGITELQASKIYKWVDDKGQAHFTTTPPSASNVVPLKTSPKDLETKKALKGVWWSKDSDATVRIEFKDSYVKFDTLRSSRAGITKKPYLLATYDIQGGRLFTGFSFHAQASLRSNSALWTLFKPKPDLLMLTRDEGQSGKAHWAIRKLKPGKSHPSGAPEGQYFCVQRPDWVLKIMQGIMVWIDKNKKQAVKGSYVKWQSPMLMIDTVFDLQDPVNPRSDEWVSIEVLTHEPHRLIMKLKTEEVLACKPMK